MKTRFLMSPPPKNWKIVGGANFRSKDKRLVDPEAALNEWSMLVSAIQQAGGDIFILDPARYTDGLSSGLVYAVNWGRFFSRANLYVLSRMQAKHRQGESAIVKRFLTNLRRNGRIDFSLDQSELIWEGQADVCDLPMGAHLVTFGPRSEELGAILSTRFFEPHSKMAICEIQEPFSHGDTCINPIRAPKGPLVLIYPGAFVDNLTIPMEQMRTRFECEVVVVGEEDARNYACNALPINGTLIYAKGLSDYLLKLLHDKGLRLEEIDMPNLFGAGGGGPRCLVNRLDEQF